MATHWLSSRFNKRAGPFVLRHALSLRYTLCRGIVRDNPTLDAFLFIPVAQKLIEIETVDDALSAKKRARDGPSSFDKFVENTFDRIFGKKSNDKSQSKPTDNYRLEAFEKYIRPILVPNERWSDVMRWHFHSRFLKWARTEYLAAKYGPVLKEAMDVYPELQLGPQTSMTPLQRKLDWWLGRFRKTNIINKDAIVPSSNVLMSALGMEKWKRHKDKNAGWKRMTRITRLLGGEMIEIRGPSMRIPAILPSTDVSSLSVEDLLEVAGGHVASCGALNVLCEEHDIYQLWTKEYIEGLAAYLMERAACFDGETLVLDVGAGDGLLAHLLANKFQREWQRRKSPTSRNKALPNRMPTMVASDNGSWRITTRALVEKLGVKEAVEKYTKDDSRRVIVLCSWMPFGEDWTKIFRSHNVNEYILIGECDEGNCGDNWETWGNSDYCDCLSESDESDSLTAESSPTKMSPPHELDGFRRIDLDDLSCHHFSRFDSADSCNSKTVVFRRELS